MTTAVDTRSDVLASLAKYGLVSGEVLNAAKSFTGGPRELLTALVEKGRLTRFQAEAVLRGAPDELVLGQFILLDELGAGSMGTVYKAKSSKEPGLFAIKTVPRKNVVNLKTIGEKVEALKEVRHPRVSAMVHIGVQAERVYMVWPFLVGGKLDEV